MRAVFPDPVALMHRTSWPSKILAGHSTWNVSSSKSSRGETFSLIFCAPVDENHVKSRRVDQSKGGGTAGVASDIACVDARGPNVTAVARAVILLILI